MSEDLNHSHMSHVKLTNSKTDLSAIALLSFDVKIIFLGGKNMKILETMKISRE